MPKREKLDSAQASVIDFVEAQEGSFYVEGEFGTGKAGGLCYQIVVDVDRLSCGRIGKIGACLEEQCKQLWDDGFDRAGVRCDLLPLMFYNLAGKDLVFWGVARHLWQMKLIYQLLFVNGDKGVCRWCEGEKLI